MTSPGSWTFNGAYRTLFSGGTDFFGTLSLGNIGGFVEHIFLALLLYKMWSVYFRSGENIEPHHQCNGAYKSLFQLRAKG